MSNAKQKVVLVASAALFLFGCLSLNRAYRQRQLNDALVAAIRKNNAGEVLSLLRRGADPNAREHVDNGFTGWDKILFCLRNRRWPESSGDPALVVSMNSMGPGNAAALKALITGGARLNVRGSSGYGIVSCAVYSGDDTLVTLALDHGANPTEANSNGGSALTDAIVLGDSKTACLLVDRGADPNERDQASRESSYWKFDREPALCCALGLMGGQEPSTALIKDLLAHGADVNASDSDGHTALMWAVTEGRDCDALIPLMLSRGATVSATDKTGATPLEMAYARQRIFLNASTNGDASRLLEPTPHLPENPNYYINDATSVIRLLKRAGAAK